MHVLVLVPCSINIEPFQVNFRLKVEVIFKKAVNDVFLLTDKSLATSKQRN